MKLHCVLSIFLLGHRNVTPTGFCSAASMPGDGASAARACHAFHAKCAAKSLKQFRSACHSDVSPCSDKSHASNASRSPDALGGWGGTRLFQTLTQSDSGSVSTSLQVAPQSPQITKS